METRPIPNAPGYFAREDGAIIGPGGYRHGPKVLKPKIDRYGYFSVSLWLNGAKRSTTASRLVALAFHGPAPTPKHHAAHRDGSRTNDVPRNIYWATPQENMADRGRHGRTIRGERHHKAILTEAAIRQARRFNAAGLSIGEIAKALGVDRSTMGQAMSGRSWPHIGSTR